MSDLSKKLSALLRDKSMKLVTAESCTGGLVAASITELPGSSDVFERGFITYSNEAKTDLLNVPKQIITANGAVSAQVAESMAKGALDNSQGDIAISITGIAGPDGGSDEKPVGTIYIGYTIKGGKTGNTHHVFEGNRDDIRQQSTEAALSLLIEILS
ncbi:MAG: hypothetical protein DHS20C02_05850 [Micavibrio sp.]|nr:MAG: hypothetical protein DHS20C02_05850 [Micavibrio sp.]